MTNEAMDRIRDALVKAENGDADALRAVLDRAVVWHTPGNNLTGGDHMGTEQTIVHLREQQRLSGGTLRVEPHGSKDAATIVLHATAQREGHGKLDLDEEIRVKVENGKIAELWTRPRDIAAWDKFWSP